MTHVRGPWWRTMAEPLRLEFASMAIAFSSSSWAMLLSNPVTCQKYPCVGSLNMLSTETVTPRQTRIETIFGPLFTSRS
jgi:hypothetical protein